MKTESNMVKCQRCGTRYTPGVSRDECPHNTINETEYFKKLHAAGRPYKLEIAAPAEVDQ